MLRRRIRSLFVAFTTAALVAGLAPAPAAARVFGGSDRDEAIARYHDALCPGIIGVQRDSAEMIVGLIRQNAAELGLHLADPETCEPNLILAVPDDSLAYANALKKRSPELFEDLDLDQRHALFETAGPARAFAQVITRTRDGMWVGRQDSLVIPPQAQAWMAHSKIYLATRRDIVTTTVLLDRNAVRGLTIAQLADYVTMRALGGDAAERLTSRGGTILGLFDGGGPRPAGLSPADRILLQTIYSTEPNIPASITLATAEQRIAAGGKLAE